MSALRSPQSRAPECRALRTALELDGDVHDTRAQREYDRARDAALAKLGVRVLRLRNGEVSLETLRKLFTP